MMWIKPNFYTGDAFPNEYESTPHAIIAWTYDWPTIRDEVEEADIKHQVVLIHPGAPLYGYRFSGFEIHDTVDVGLIDPLWVEAVHRRTDKPL